MNPILRRRWLAVLTTMLATMYVMIGVAGRGSLLLTGLLGAGAILGSLALGRRYHLLAIALLVLGMAPLVALTWWSIVTPVIALVCLIVGWPRRARATSARTE